MQGSIYLKEKLKYALIGCGRIAINHIHAFDENRRSLELVALCDIIPKHADNLIKRSGTNDNPKVYSDYKDMLEKEKPDLVAVATESGSHSKIAVDAMNAGANVIVEKPFAMSMSEAQDMIDIQKKTGKVLYPCHQNRFNKAVLKIREALEDGKFGKLLHGTAHIRWKRDQGYYNQAPWRGTWEQDGGALMNQCIHNIDLLRWMMGGEAEEVFAYTDNLIHDYIEAEDLGVALVKFSNGSYGIIEGTTNVFPKNLEETLYIFGENGTVKAGGQSVNKIETWRFKNDDDEERVVTEFTEDPPNIYGFGHIKLYADAIAAVKGEKEQYIKAEDGARALELVLAIYKSKKTGLPVKLPLNDFASTDMTGTFG